MITLSQWVEAEKRINASQVPDTLPLLDCLPSEYVEGLSPLAALALTHDPRAYLRGRQRLSGSVFGGEWLVAIFMCGRGWGKSLAAAGWVIEQILAGTVDEPAGTFALVAPKEDDAWKLQWRVIKKLLPPWVRYQVHRTRREVVFPDHGARLWIHSAEVSEYRGPNLRGAWCEEPCKWPRGEALWDTLNKAVRVPGSTPPRIVLTTTPPEELNWILKECVDSDTIVIRGTMRDNPALDRRKVESEYRKGGNTIQAQRELDGKCIFGVDGALFRADCLERFRVDEVPPCEAIVVSVDPAQSAKADADPVGIVVVGFAMGHLYVLASCSERLEPEEWATRAIDWAGQWHAGRYIVEPTGSGSYPRATLEAHQRIVKAARLPIVDSKARGSKADRAQPLSAAAARGRLHMVGYHLELERELTTWFPGAKWSPNGLDALVHGASVLTNNWRNLG